MILAEGTTVSLLWNPKIQVCPGCPPCACPQLSAKAKVSRDQLALPPSCHQYLGEPCRVAEDGDPRTPTTVPASTAAFSEVLCPEPRCRSPEQSRDLGPGPWMGDKPRLPTAVLGPRPHSLTKQGIPRKQKLHELWVPSWEWRRCGLTCVSAWEAPDLTSPGRNEIAPFHRGGGSRIRPPCLPHPLPTGSCENHVACSSRGSTEPAGLPRWGRKMKEFTRE